MVDRVDEAVLQRLRARPDVSAVRAGATLSTRVRLPGGPWRPALLFVHPPAPGPALARPRLQAGHWPQADDDEVLIERDAVRVLGPGPITALQLDDGQGGVQALRLSGLVHDAALAPASQEGMVWGYVDESFLRRVPALRPAPFVLVRLHAVDDADTSPAAQAAADQGARALARELQAQGLAAHELRVPPPGVHPHQRQANGAVRMLAACALLAMALCALSAATLMHGWMDRHAPQIGVMKTLGASTAIIVRSYAAVLLGLGALAALGGMGLGWAAGDELARVTAGLLNLDLAGGPGAAPALWTGGLLCLALPLLAALGPMLQVARRDVAQALARRDITRPDALDRLVSRGAGLPLPLPLRLALRHSVRRRRRFGLTVLLLAAAGAVFMGSLNLRQAWWQLADQAAAQRHDALELRLVQPQSTAALQAWLNAQPEVQQAEAWNAWPALWDIPGQPPLSRTYPDRSHGQLTLRTVPAGATLLRTPMLQGRWLDADGGLVMNSAARHQLGPSASLGQPLALRVQGAAEVHSVSARWVGEIDEALAPPTVYLPVSQGPADGQARSTHWRLRLQPGTDPGAAADGLRQRLAAAGWPVARVQTEQGLRAGAASHVLVLVRSLAVVAVALALVGLMALVTALAAGVRERRAELGVLQALGATPRQLALTVVCEGLLAAAASVALALLLGLAVDLWMAAQMARVSAQPVRPALSVLGVAAWTLIVALGALLACAWPARAAARVSVKSALAEG